MPAVAHIDAGALVHNLEQIRQSLPNKEILAMIKANAYGHDAVAVAETLTMADYFGVANVNEAVKLRQQGVKKDLFIQQGFFDQTGFDLCVQYNLEPCIHHEQQLSFLASLKHPLTVWLKINSGMNRLGFKPAEVQLVYQRLLANAYIEDIKVLTHFSCADDADSDFTAQQYQCFERVTRDWPVSKSCGNSATILQYPQFAGDIIRPGLMLYGVDPEDIQYAHRWRLKPVMTLQANIIALQTLKAGDVVGYGNTWRAPQAATIAIIDMGYADGYPQFASTSTPVMINGQQAHLVGRVSMDSLAVDVTDITSPCIGDLVELWGKNLPIDKVAQATGHSSYALLSGLGPRVQRFCK